VSVTMMRAWIVLASLWVSTLRSEACPDYDLTFVRGAYVVEPTPRWQEPRHGPVPPNPRLFIHLGTDSEPGLPAFLGADGSRIPFTLRIVDTRRPLLAADLEIEAGVIFVHHPGARVASEVFVVVPSQVPSTRAVQFKRDQGDTWLEVDSDAALFVVEQNGTHETRFNGGYVHVFDEHRPFRVTAVYADRGEEVILDHRPPRPRPLPWREALLILVTAIGVWLLRYKAPATRAA
jgi:hypothetical protein